MYEESKRSTGWELPKAGWVPRGQSEQGSCTAICVQYGNTHTYKRLHIFNFSNINCESDQQHYFCTEKENCNMTQIMDVNKLWKWNLAISINSHNRHISIFIAIIGFHGDISGLPERADCIGEEQVGQSCRAWVNGKTESEKAFPKKEDSLISPIQSWWKSKWLW